MLRGLLIFVFLAACTPRPVLAPLPEGVAAARTETVFTATNRGLTTAGPGKERSEALTFSKLAISVPPNRRPGQIVTPRRRDPDPLTDFLVAGQERYAGGRDFEVALRRELRARRSGNRDVMIYVHGFNNTYPEGVLRMAQLTRDMDFNSTAIHFAWPSAANPLAYERDRGSALFSRDALEELIAMTKRAGARRVTIIAHSMGGFLTMETLRQMAIARPGSVARDVHGVLLFSPDIDISVFRTQARRIGELPEAFAIFVSDRDRALQLSARLTGENERLGTLSDPSLIGDLKVAVIDVSHFSEGAGHFVPGTSPEVLEYLSRAAEVDNAFTADAAGRTGLLPGSVLTIQNVTEFVLLPTTLIQ